MLAVLVEGPTIIKVCTKVFYISLIELALKKVLLEKKVKVEADKEKFNVKKILDLCY